MAVGAADAVSKSVPVERMETLAMAGCSLWEWPHCTAAGVVVCVALGPDDKAGM